MFGSLFSKSKDTGQKYLFRLYVAGETDYSLRILENLKAALTERLRSDYQVQIVNVLYDSKRAKDDGISVTPAVARIRPEPVERYTGTLYKPEHVRAAVMALLGITKEPKSAPS